MIIGIDIGGSTTQGVLLRNGKTTSFTSIHASDAVASASGCLGKIITENRIKIDRIMAVAATGGGAGKLNRSLLGIPVRKVEEIKAIGLGGMMLTGKKRCFVVSIGTGTAMVAVTEGGNVIKHAGGTGVGGGTLKGLFKLLLNKEDINNLEILAGKGNLKKINLTVKDIVGKGIGELSADATAANFGKLCDETSENDIALGLIHMVGEIVGTLSVFAAKNHGLEKDIVFIGKVTRNKTLMKKLQEAVRTFGGRAVVPEHAEFATAIGAARALTIGENASFLEKLRKKMKNNGNCKKKKSR